MENLYNLCLKVVKEYPEVKYIRYNRELIRPLNINGEKCNIEDAAKCCSIEGNFTFKVYDEEYEDYDGKDENGRPIILYRTYKVCDIYGK